MTEQIRQFPGSIGYVELTYAQQNHLPVAALGNQAGKYVLPSKESATAAIAVSADALAKDPRFPTSTRQPLPPTRTPSPPSPSSCFPRTAPDQAAAQPSSIFAYVIGDGQTVASQLDYAPLPDAVKQYDQQQLDLLTAGGQPIH